MNEQFLGLGRKKSTSDAIFKKFLSKIDNFVWKQLYEGFILMKLKSNYLPLNNWKWVIKKWLVTTDMLIRLSVVKYVHFINDVSRMLWCGIRIYRWHSNFRFSEMGNTNLVDSVEQYILYYQIIPILSKHLSQLHTIFSPNHA